MNPKVAIAGVNVSFSTLLAVFALAAVFTQIPFISEVTTPELVAALAVINAFKDVALEAIPI